MSYLWSKNQLWIKKNFKYVGFDYFINTNKESSTN